MKNLRALFLVFNSMVALAIGGFACGFPHLLLDAKGVAPPHGAAAVWVREVGVLIFALGVVLFLVRRHADSATMRALFLGTAIVHLGLLPIEIAAYHAGVVTRLSGVAPNSVLHGVLGTGFLILAIRTKVRTG